MVVTGTQSDTRHLGSKPLFDSLFARQLLRMQARRARCSYPRVLSRGSHLEAQQPS